MLTLAADNFCVTGDTSTAQFSDLAALAREHGVLLIDALGGGPLASLGADIGWSDRSARTSLSSGAQLVIVRGDGLAGGPPCGILAGSQSLIQRAVEHPLFVAHQLEPERSAALAASLQCLVNYPAGECSLPILDLLSSPLENLHNRAERLAPQLAQADGIRSADVVSLMSQCDGLALSGRTLRSFGVALTPSSGDVISLERLLATAPLPVIGRVNGDRLLLDLRTVLPRHDQAIVRALLGQPRAAEAMQNGEQPVTAEAAPRSPSS